MATWSGMPACVPAGSAELHSAVGARFLSASSNAVQPGPFSSRSLRITFSSRSPTIAPEGIAFTDRTRKIPSLLQGSSFFFGILLRWRPWISREKASEERAAPERSGLFPCQRTVRFSWSESCHLHTPCRANNIIKVGKISQKKLRKTAKKHANLVMVLACDLARSRTEGQNRTAEYRTTNNERRRKKQKRIDSSFEFVVRHSTFDFELSCGHRPGSHFRSWEKARSFSDFRDLVLHSIAIRCMPAMLSSL